MNSKHKKTLQAILTKPILAGIRWKDIEALLINIDCVITEGAGSRVRFTYIDYREHEFKLTVHRPHPDPNASKVLVKAVASFLKDIGVKNENEI